MAVTAGDIKFYKSSQSNGGTINEAAELTGSLKDEVFPSVAFSGTTETITYKKIFVKNTNTTSNLTNVSVLVTETSSPDDTIFWHLGTSTDTEDDISEFSWIPANTSSETFDLNANSSQGIWLKRVVNANGSAMTSSCTLSIEGTSA